MHDRLMEVEEFYSPESSNILGASYYPRTEVLRVRFKRKGELDSTYDYEGVTEATWKAFKTAESKGKFFAAHVKEQHKMTKVA